MAKCSKALEIAQCEKGLHYSYPPNPFECKIPGGLIDGRKVFLHAIAYPETDRFAINFQTGGGDSSDIAFHLNPRFDEKNIVMNSRISDEWGSEERISDIPITKLNSFLICVTATQKTYEVEIFDKWVGSFDHRIPIQKVTHLSVAGDIGIIGVHILDQELPNERIIIPGGMKPGHSISVNGKCNSDFSQFYLNLQCGDSDDDDVALHFNPRGSDQVVTNSHISGSWGDEERAEDSPFGSNETFCICITAHENEFDIKVNGQLFPNYAHRLPIDRICTLILQGDAKMRDVSIGLPSNIKTEKDFVKKEVIDPAVPCTEELSGFKPGCFINLIGEVHDDPTRFKINFQSGPREEDDVMLHLNPRWDQGEPKVVINSRENDDWGDEELWNAGHFPFQANTMFDMGIFCEDDGFRIVVDGFEQLFKHRIDCTKVSHVFVNGSINMKRILYQ